MKNPMSLGLATGLVGLACAAEARAATINRDGSPLVFVSTVTVGDETWVKVWENYRDASDFIHVIPLPEGATEPRLAKIPEAADPTTAPRAFKVEPVTACDTSWSCSVDRGPAEPSAPAPPDPRAVSGRPIPDCFATSDKVPPPPSPPPPPDQLRIVARDQIVPTARKLAPHFAEHAGRWPRCGPLVFLPGFAANLPDVSRFAVVAGGDHALAFRVRGAFKWPLVPPSDGGPREVIMLAVSEAPPPGGSTYFPRALLRSEPPRLYLGRGTNDEPSGDPQGMASLLADQLAYQGRHALLERAMLLDANVRVLPNTALLSELGPPKLPPATKPRSFKLFRYRFRSVSDIGLSPTAEAELPHPRELATGFVTVVPNAKNPRCPASCYRPHLENGVWTTSAHTYHESFPSGHLEDGIVRLVEAPFSLATPVVRDPSPFPPLPTPASATPAPPPAPSASAATPAPARAPAPAPAPPGPRGCTCDTVPVPRSGPGAAIGRLVIIALWIARRRRAEDVPR